MKWLLKILFASATMILLGIVLIISGIGFVLNGFGHRIPERSQLEIIAGTLVDKTEKAVSAPGQDRRSWFELELSPRGILVLTTERLAMMNLKPSQLSELKGKRIVALVTPQTNYEVWEFIADDKTLLNYDAEMALYYRMRIKFGLIMGAAGCLILAAGLIALRIRQYRRTATHWPR